MQYRAVGAVAIWLAGGTVLAGDTAVAAKSASTPAQTSPAPADFPPPAAVPPSLLPPPAETPRPLPALPEVSPALPLARELEPPKPKPFVSDSPYFAVANLTSVEIRSTAPTQPLPLQVLPGILGSVPMDRMPRDLQPMPLANADQSAVTPYYGTTSVPMSPATAPTVLDATTTSPADEGFGRYLFGSADFLVFKVRKGPAPPLVQVVPADVAQMSLTTGADLPAGAASTVYGATGIDAGTFSGFRGQIGLWLNGSGTVGVDASYLHLDEQSSSFSIRSDGVPVIGRGYVDAAIQRDATVFYSTPDGVSRGFINIDAPTELQTFDANLRVKGTAIYADRVDFTAGVRYLRLREGLTINSGVDIANPVGSPATTITSLESFQTRNEFYGSQFGIESHFYYGALTLDVSGKLASGWVREQVDISGGSRFAAPGQAIQDLPNRSILYVQPTNAGSYERNKFALLPELLVRLGYQLTPNMRATVGYNILAVTSVVRPGSAIDSGINPTLTPFLTPRQASDINRPAFAFNGTDFWAQGLTVGVTITY